MHSTAEHLQEVLRRAELLKQKKTVRKRIVLSGLSSGLCILLIALSVLSFPQFLTTEGGVRLPQVYGSLIYTSPAAGYVVISLLAFALGISVTLFFRHWKKLKELSREKERKN